MAMDCSSVYSCSFGLARRDRGFRRPADEAGKDFNRTRPASCGCRRIPEVGY